MALPIGGFMPIPLAMMIPFMATQSMVMGDAFGRAFQYGKRKISAMSNEEFNATSLEQQASEMFKAYKIIIGDNHLQNAILESSELQKVIIQEMLLILPKFVSQTGTDLIGGKTDIITTPTETHPHSIDRPHTHSEASGKAAPPTITGKTISNGITTIYWSDGTTTTSGVSIKAIVKKYRIKIPNGFEAKGGTNRFTYQTNTMSLEQWKTFLAAQRKAILGDSNPTKQRLWLEQIRIVSVILKDQTGVWY